MRCRKADTGESDLALQRMENGVQTMVSRGTSLVASRMKTAAASKTKTGTHVASIPAMFRLSDLTDDDTTKRSGEAKEAPKPRGEAFKPRSQVQTLIFNNGKANGAKATLDMNYLVTALILEEGLPFSLAHSPNLHRIIMHARNLPNKYSIPHRNEISTKYMDILYDQRVQSNDRLLLLEATIYGLGLYCDGATIKRCPLYNFLACGVHMPHAVLEIKDCTEQMAMGGKKDARFISEIMSKHIDRLDPNQVAVDLVLFDGAANVQKAGRILEAKYPRITCIHGAEHVVALFFSGFGKTEVGRLFIRLYQLIFKWFGGRHHAPHAMFMANSKRCNGGHMLGLIRVAETRMGGYAIAFTRLIRHKSTFESLFVDPAFKCWLRKEPKAPRALVELLKNAHLWKFLLVLLRSLHGAYLTLRHADSKTAGMDWLHYNVCRVTESLADNHATLNQWDEMDRALFIDDLVDLVGATAEGCEDWKTETEPATTDDDSSVDSEVVPKFGTVIRALWQKQLCHLNHAYAHAAYVLAVDERIRDHCRANIHYLHKKNCEHLLRKLFMPIDLDPNDESSWMATTFDEFWDEYDQFDNRLGPFGEGRSFIWESLDAKTYQTYKWHKKYSLVQTKWLGRLACRVTSKILGMGNAERSWGFVKQLKDGQRSHLSAEAASKASTIYGAACAERASFKKPPAHLAEVTHWEDGDLESLGLSRYGVDLDAIMAVELSAKVYKCWTEDWEFDILHEGGELNELKFLSKYGGLVFQDGDTMYTGNREKLLFCKSGGNKRWMIIGCQEEDDPETDRAFEIDDDFHGIVFEYYRLNPDPLVRIVAPPEALDADGAWGNWVPEREPTPKKRKRN
jgi:hypothetical protein